ncbi:MAG: TonB-dependent receptor [Blastocatellia bacterium]
MAPKNLSLGSLWLLCLVVTLASGQPRTSLRGCLLDAQTGQPRVGVEIKIADSEWHTKTDQQGCFAFPQLAAPTIELLIFGSSTIRQRVVLQPAQETFIEIKLTGEAALLTDSLTISSATSSLTSMAVEHSLQRTQLTALAGGVMSDPLRAVQALPGVISNDDMNNQINLRGAGLQRLGFYVDGILTDAPAHAVKDEQGGFSISSLNMESVGSLTLLAGNYSAEYGDSTAGALTLDPRDGSRQRTGLRLVTNFLNSSLVAEGPFARQHGSWLVAARSSYMNYILQRMDKPGVVFDFSDLQARAVQDVSAHHQFSLTAVLGTTAIDQKARRSQLTLQELLESHSDSRLLVARWSASPSARLSVQTRVFQSQAGFTNRNPTDLVAEEGERLQWGGRSDLYWEVNPSHQLQAGVYLRTVQATHTQRVPWDRQPAQFTLLNQYRQRAFQQAAYVQETWQAPQQRFSLTGGVRLDATSLTGEKVFSPRLSFRFVPAAKTILRVGISQHAQFPDVEYLYGLGGNPQLKSEQATHYNVAVERPLGQQTQLTVEAYDREDRRLIFSLDDVLQQASLPVTGRFPRQNTLNGYARGIEITLRRSAGKRLEGWFSYSNSRTWLRDQASHTAFVSDYDQRHTISTYGSFRFSDRLETNFLWRYGSGLPKTGFLPQTDGAAAVLSERNSLRLPFYSRLDWRLHRHFQFDHWRLQITAEILNVLAHENVRQVKTGMQPLLPFVPSLGVTIDF